MPRLMLNDELWSKLKSILLQYRIYNKTGLRKTVEGVLFRLRTGLPWRDLPEYFGHWNSVFKTFNNWAKRGVWQKVFNALKVDPDFEWGFIDGSYVKAHQHSAGAKSDEQGIGLSRGGKTTKIHMVVDGFGLPIDFEITGGQVHDSEIADELIDRTNVFEFMMADKGYDKESLRELLVKKGSTPIIPRRNNSTIGNDDIDWALYRHRHLVENFFARIKHYRGIATRFDKLKRNFESSVAIVCAMAWIKM
jgi:transposase